MSERLKGLVVVLLSASVCVLASELFLRVLFPQSTYNRLLASSPRMFRESDLFPYEMIPSYKGKLIREEFETTITLNSMEYRSREFNVDKRGRFRVLVVGDSFTFGWGVEDNETYPARIEKIVANEHHRNDVEVINASFAAGSPDIYYLFIKERGLQLKPDLILIGFFVGNDIVDRREFVQVEWTKTDREGLPLQIKSLDSEVENGRWVKKQKRRQLIYRLPILRNSHLFHLLVSSGRGLKRLLKSESERLLETFNPYIYDATYSERTRAAVQRTQTLFRAMAKLAASQKVPLAVIMIPAREQVHAEQLHREVRRSRDLDKPQRVFGAFFDAEHIPYLDLLPGLRAKAQGNEFYFRYDLHWNAKGHEFAAGTISTFLVDNSLLRASNGARGALAFSSAS